MATLFIQEWTRANPETHDQLSGVVLPRDISTSRTLATLKEHNVLKVRELRSGLEVETFSWVGRFELGPLTISVQPKLDQMRLVPLLRYAYGLRDVELLTSPEHSVADHGFVELLVLQLVREAEEIVARGMHRRYELLEEWLEGVRGRIDFARLAAAGGIFRAALPCNHYPRTEDCLPNQALRSGLILAARLAQDPWLSGRAWRLSQAFESVTEIPLVHETFAALESTRSRLTEVYAPALRLVRILWQGHAAVLDDGEGRKVRLEGFLLDMNRFFQALLGRFLSENLQQYRVVEEEALTPIFRYAAGQNPCNRRAPRPRPDFIIRDGATTVALLDAKYRDLWENPLPREMLYQLSIYALGQPDVGTAVILHPAMSSAATEQRLEILDPLNREALAAVVMRPVDLTRLSTLVSADAYHTQEERRALAKEWVQGAPGQAASAWSPPVLPQIGQI